MYSQSHQVRSPIRNRIAGITLALALGFVARSSAAGSETNRFVVLELKVTATEVTVVAATEVAGQPKLRTTKAGVDFLGVPRFRR